MSPNDPSSAVALREGVAAEAVLSSSRLKQVTQRFEQLIATDAPAGVMLVARRGVVALHEACGQITTLTGDKRATDLNSVWLLASITKPFAGLAALLQAQVGRLDLDAPVEKYLPEFKGGLRPQIKVRHLLTHTSGLPDMLPNNKELRQAHAPLKKFVEGALQVPVEFEPGTEIQYQSMGILLAAEIVERLTGRRLRDYLRDETFVPLGMNDSHLGLRVDLRHRIPRNVHSEEAERGGWSWNSDYWRDLGVPWGGMHATAWDVAIAFQMLMNQGRYGTRTILNRENARAMTSDQSSKMTGIPPERRRHAPWGLTVAMNGTAKLCRFSDQASPRTFGHYGATGTVVWADPTRELLCVILTNGGLDTVRDDLVAISDLVFDSVAD